MKTSHHADGPGGNVLPGPGNRRAIFANDNAPRLVARECPALGVVLSMETCRDGWSAAAIRLLGARSTLSAPIHVATETSDIVAIWRGFGRDLNLPLYLRDASGVMTPVTPLMGEVVHPHRKGSPLSGRRPRFLTRRRMPLAAPGVESGRKEGRRR